MSAPAATAVPDHRRGWVLALCATTIMFVLSAPGAAMPVLFPQIAADLHLSLVQIGVLWGVAPLAGAVAGLLGGMAADVRGARAVIVTGCVVCAAAGAARAFSWGFVSLAFFTVLLGVAGSPLPNSLHKTAGQWFSPRSFGKANAVISVGVAAGAMLGSLASAAYLAPLVGGWRGVVVVYGVVAVVFGVLWLAAPPSPRTQGATRGRWTLADFRATVASVVPIRAFWVLTAACFCYSAYYMGFAGYLPTYLTDQGWSTAAAGGAAAAFQAASMAGVYPLTLLAERYHVRRGMMAATGLCALAGLVVISATAGPWVWPAVVLMGLFHDLFMTLSITTVVQIAGIGPSLAGTALGLTMSLQRVGGFVSPPLGNSMAAFGAGAPFLLWAGFALAMLVLVTRVRPREAVSLAGDAPARSSTSRVTPSERGA